MRQITKLIFKRLQLSKIKTDLSDIMEGGRMETTNELASSQNKPFGNYVVQSNTCSICEST